MKLSLREKWLLVVVVPVLTLVAFELMLLRPLRRNVTELTREMDAKEDRTAWQSQLQQAHLQHQKLEADLEKLRSPAVDGTASRIDHPQALKEVSQLCQQNGLVLISSTADTSVALPPSLQSASPILAKQSDGTPPEAWRIDLQGSYQQMQALLESLAKTRPLIVPLTVAMKVDEEGVQATSWVLTLWL